jgi:hypothetical protein
MTVLKARNVRHFDTVRSSVRFSDAILNNVSEEEMAKYFAGRAKLNPGKVWDGVLKPLLQSLDKKTRDQILKNLDDDYGNELATSKAEGENEPLGLQFGGENQDEEEVEGQAIVEGTGTQDNIACNSKGGRKLRSWRDANASAIDAVQKANADFWARK